MHFLERWFPKHKKSEPIQVDVLVRFVLPQPSGVVAQIVFSSITINNQKTEGIIMAKTFGKAQKAPYTLSYIGLSGNVTTDPVTNLVLTSGDPTVVTVDPINGFFVGVADGSATITANALNSLGQPVTGSVLITISDTTTPPTVDPVASIGITVGTPVAQ